MAINSSTREEFRSDRFTNRYLFGETTGKFLVVDIGRSISFSGLTQRLFESVDYQWVELSAGVPTKLVKCEGLG